MLVELWKNHEMCEYEENLPRLCNAGRFSMMFVLYSLYIFPELMKMHICTLVSFAITGKKIGHIIKAIPGIHRYYISLKSTNTKVDIVETQTIKRVIENYSAYLFFFSALTIFRGICMWRQNICRSPCRFKRIDGTNLLEKRIIFSG